MLMLPAAYDRKISYIKYQKKLPEDGGFFVYRLFLSLTN